MGGGRKERQQGSLLIACVWVEGGVTCTSGEEREKEICNYRAVKADW